MHLVAVVSLVLNAIASEPKVAKPVWEPLGLSGGGAMFSPAISPLDRNLMMLNCDMGAAYLSQDGGRNWRMIHHAQLRSDTQCRPAFHPSDPKVIYASSGGKLRVSRDGGQTFKALGNLKESLSGEIAINPSNPDLLLAGTRNGHCWVSLNSGMTWTVCRGPQGRALGFHFDRTKQGTMFAATVQGIWRSDDGGTTWAEKTHGLPGNTVQGFAAGSNESENLLRLYCSVPSQIDKGVLTGGIYRSRDRGETWEPAMGKGINTETAKADVGSSRVDLQACKLEYSIVSPK